MTKNFIHKITSALNEHKVKYVVTGGVAMLLRNEKKTTMDLDLLVSVNKENISAIKEFAKSFKINNLEVFEDLTSEKIVRIKIFPFSIDFMPKLDGLNTEEIFKNKDIINYSGINIPLITKKELEVNYNNF